ENVQPSQVTNLTTSFITVNGKVSGLHSGLTHVAIDGRTVIFETGADFHSNELVTVTLNPLLAAVASGSVEPYKYQLSIELATPGSQPLAAISPPVSPRAELASEPRQPLPKIKATPGSPVKRAAMMLNGVSVPGDFPYVLITANSNPSPGYVFIENA